MKKWIALLLAVLICLSCTACGNEVNTTSSAVNGGEEDTSSTVSSSAESEVEIPAGTTPDVAHPVLLENMTVTLPTADVPVVGTISENYDAAITLNGDGTQVTGSGASVSGNVVTIARAGTYLVTGSLDGQLVVNTADEEKVKLLFNGVSLTFEGPALYCESCPKKLVIETMPGSVNILTDTRPAAEEKDDTALDACLYSVGDLNLQGDGALYVNGGYARGIFTKDDLEIEGGTVVVQAADDGIRGRDSLTVSGGEIYISCGADGLRTSNDENTEKGDILISGGVFYIDAGLDAIQAVKDVVISGGMFTLVTNGGYTNGVQHTDDMMGGFGGGPGGFGGPGGMGPGGMGGFGGTSTETEEDTESCKGIKAAALLAVSGGSFAINTSDDALHTNGTMTVSGGKFTVYSGDDGLHADTELTVSGGSLWLQTCYEGIESTDIILSGGEAYIIASDDGLNAAGGADGSSMGGRPGQNMFSGDTGSITITNGYLYIDAAGDGIDSNGTVDMTGGTAIVFGPENGGNGPLDYQNTFTISGGFLLASGSSGMAQKVTNTGQGQIACAFGNTTGIAAVLDADENVVFAYDSPKSFGCFVLCAPQIKTGAAYSIYVGGTLQGENTNGVYTGEITYAGGTLLGTLNAE